MTDVKRLLILNGSPRKKGTSFSFARTLGMLASEHGINTEIRHAVDYFDGRDEMEDLAGLISESDVIALTAPLYVDALPYIDIWLLEKLAREYGESLKGKGFFAVGQCGFPDITRIEPIIDCCRLFAGETGMRWLGGLAYGGGAIINGALLEDFGKSGRRIISGFRLAIGSIAGGREIPAEAQDMITLKLPRLLLPLLALYLNHNVRKLARENGNADYTARPYLE